MWWTLTTREHEAERVVVARILSLRAGTEVALVHAARVARLCRALPPTTAKGAGAGAQGANSPTKSRAGKAFLTAPRSKTMRLAAPVGQRRRRPSFLRAVTAPSAALYTTLKRWASLRAKYRLSLFGALFSPMLSLALPALAVAALHEFGREVSDLQYRAATRGAEDARFLLDWLKALDYENTCTTAKTASGWPARWSRACWNFATGWPSAAAWQIDDVAGLEPAS